jgi:membrane protein
MIGVSLINLTMLVQKIKDRLERIARKPKVRFALAIYGNYNEHNGPFLAAGLAFFLLLSVVPLLLLGVACLGFYLSATGSTDDAAKTVQFWLSNHVLPGVSNKVAVDLIARLDVPGKMAKITHFRSTSGIVGFVGLIWASMQIFVSGSVAMNLAWGVRETRNWLKLHLVAFWLLLGSGALMGLSIAATTAGTLWSKYVPSLAVTAGTELAALVPAFITYAMIFRALPSATVSVKSASFGALISSILWEIAKKGLAIYLVHPNAGIYGSLAGLFALVLWIYYSMMILLIGAEASATYASRFEKGAANTNVSR